jgi:hypothetical protein
MRGMRADITAGVITAKQIRINPRAGRVARRSSG